MTHSLVVTSLCTNAKTSHLIVDHLQLSVDFRESIIPPMVQLCFAHTCYCAAYRRLYHLVFDNIIRDGGLLLSLASSELLSNSGVYLKSVLRTTPRLR